MISSILTTTTLLLHVISNNGSFCTTNMTEDCFIGELRQLGYYSCKHESNNG